MSKYRFPEEATSETASRSWRGPLTAVVAVVLLIVSFGSWAFSSAVGGAPDDDYHLSSIWCSSFAGDTCEVDPGGEGVYIPESLREGIYCYYHNPTQSAGCQPFMDGTDPRPDVPFAHNNPSRNLYPDGYYNFSSLLKTDSIEATALAVRLVNLGIFLGMAISLFFLLPQRLRTTWLWMWVIGLVPMGMFIIPSSNPSSWGITAVASGWIALLGYLESRGPRAWALGGVFILAGILALNARIDAVLYLGLASVVAVWLSPKRGRELLVKIWPGFIVIALVIVQLIVNPANLERVVQGIGQRSDTISDPLPWTTSPEVADGSAFDWALLWNNLWSIPGLWLGVFGGYPWGSLGWLDTALPQVVVVGTMTVALGVTFLAVRSADKKKIVGLIVMLGAIWVMPLYLLQLGGFLAGEEVQPRYLLPLMMVLLGTVVLTNDGSPIVSDRGRLWFILAALTIANAISLHTNIRRYTTGISIQGFNLDSPREWWWPFFPEFLGPTLLWAIGSLAFGGLLWLLFFRVVPSITESLGIKNHSKEPLNA
jgi:hypothetical protein